MEQVVVLTVIFMVGFFFWVRGVIIREQKARKKESRRAKEEYRKTLEELKANPSSPELREKVLKAGRYLILFVKNFGEPDDPHNLNKDRLSDLRLSQDIEAACAGATLSVLNKAPDGVAVEIAKLAELRQQGILTGDEFDIGKAYMLGHNKTDELAKKITVLYRLREQGAITEGEFNLKKWDLLSRK